MNRLDELKNELDNIMHSMPQSYEEQRIRNQQAFELSREIEKLENPQDFQKNIKHWNRG